MIEMYAAAMDIVMPRYVTTFDSDRGTDYGTIMTVQVKRDGRRFVRDQAFVARDQRVPLRFRRPQLFRLLGLLAILGAGLAFGELFALVIRWSYP